VAPGGGVDVIVGLDAEGRIVNIEIGFAEYYFQDREAARSILRGARW
jgi:hypothetical protein